MPSSHDHHHHHAEPVFDPATAPFHCISPEEAAALILRAQAATPRGLTILDCRDTASYRQAHVAGAISLSDANEGPLLAKLAKDKPVLLYCYHGNASRGRANTFCDFRFQEVYSVDGGYGPLSAALRAQAAATDPSEARFTPALQRFLAAWSFDPADLTAPRKNNLTPLMRAALIGNSSVVAELIALGIDVTCLNDDGNNALWLACVSGNGVVVQRLIDAGIPIDNRNLLGATALMYCASSGRADMLKLLLDNGADPLVENFDGARAAELCSTTDCLRLLRATAR